MVLNIKGVLQPLAASKSAAADTAVNAAIHRTASRARPIQGRERNLGALALISQTLPQSAPMWDSQR
jgi:hypothetical protein